MKQLLSFFCAVLVAITAFGQSSPPNKLRSNDSFTQVDNYLVAAKRLGIPSGPTPTLDASTTSENSTKLFYDTDDGLLMVYNVSTSTWSPVSSDVDLTNYYTRSQVDSAITAQAGAYLPLAGGTMSGNINMGGNDIFDGGFIRSGGNNNFIGIHRSGGGSILTFNNTNIPAGSASHILILDTDNTGAIRISTPTGTTPSNPEKFRILGGDNVAAPNMTVAQFFGSVTGRMDGTSDPDGYESQFTTQDYVDGAIGAKLDTAAYGFGLSWNPTTQKMDWGEHLEDPGFSGGQYVVRVPEASVVGLGDINSSDASFLAIKMGGLSSTGLTVGDRSTAQNIGVAAENLGVQQIRFFSPNGNMTYGSDGVLNYSIDKSSSYTNRSVVDKAYVDVQVSDSTLKNISVFNPRRAANIKTISYTWKDGRDSLTHIGYTAQDVQKYLPEAVELKSSGVLGVRYLEVLAAKIAALEERLAELESK